MQGALQNVAAKIGHFVDKVNQFAREEAAGFACGAQALAGCEVPPSGHFGAELGLAVLLTGMKAPVASSAGDLELGTAVSADHAPGWPGSAEEMDQFLGTQGTRVPDGPSTPGRGKVVWQPNSNTRITFEQHPYDVNAPNWHKGPHWHLDTPGTPHARYLPGEPIPD